MATPLDLEHVFDRLWGMPTAHQLETRAGWGYPVLDAGLWLWSDPHGQQFLRDRVGTSDVTPARRCRRQE